MLQILIWAISAGVMIISTLPLFLVTCATGLEADAKGRVKAWAWTLLVAGCLSGLFMIVTANGQASSFPAY